MAILKFEDFLGESKVIGKTKSGKDIHDSVGGAKDYTADDHSDAVTLHQKKAKELKDSDPDKSASHRGLAQMHHTAMKKKQE